IALVAGDPVGVKRATVPSMASVDISVRTVAGQSVNEVAALIRRWFEVHKSPDFDYRLSVDTETAQEPYRTPPNPVLDALSRS
ncbi:hypothetical protein SB764_43155, partial [Paraburkholderia sp. SIMBA_027]